MMMKHGLNGFAVLAGALALAACGGEAEAPAEVAGDCPPGVTVTDGWLSLPAVEANPGAAYFTISNTGEDTYMIRAAEVLGAESAMMHDTGTWAMEVVMNELPQVGLAPGDTVVFEPGGKHIMAMGIGAGVAAGGETEVTLTFAGGDKCSFTVQAYPAGETPEGFTPSGEGDDAA